MFKISPKQMDPSKTCPAITPFSFLFFFSNLGNVTLNNQSLSYNAQFGQTIHSTSTSFSLLSLISLYSHAPSDHHTYLSLSSLFFLIPHVASPSTPYFSSLFPMLPQTTIHSLISFISFLSTSSGSHRTYPPHACNSWETWMVGSTRPIHDGTCSPRSPRAPQQILRLRFSIK